MNMTHPPTCSITATAHAPGGRRCNCGIVGSIERALQSATLTQALIEAGPADVQMTNATVALSAAKDALRTALGRAYE